MQKEQFSESKIRAKSRKADNEDIMTDADKKQARKKKRKLKLNPKIGAMFDFTPEKDDPPSTSKPAVKEGPHIKNDQGKENSLFDMTASNGDRKVHDIVKENQILLDKKCSERNSLAAMHNDSLDNIECVPESQTSCNNTHTTPVNKPRPSANKLSLSRNKKTSAAKTVIKSDKSLKLREAVSFSSDEDFVHSPKPLPTSMPDISKLSEKLENIFSKETKKHSVKKPSAKVNSKKVTKIKKLQESVIFSDEEDIFKEPVFPIVAQVPNISSNSSCENTNLNMDITIDMLSDKLSAILGNPKKFKTTKKKVNSHGINKPKSSLKKIKKTEDTPTSFKIPKMSLKFEDGHTNTKNISILQNPSAESAETSVSPNVHLQDSVTFDNVSSNQDAEAAVKDVSLQVSICSTLSGEAVGTESEASPQSIRNESEASSQSKTEWDVSPHLAKTDAKVSQWSITASEASLESTNSENLDLELSDIEKKKRDCALQVSLTSQQSQSPDIVKDPDLSPLTNSISKEFMLQVPMTQEGHKIDISGVTKSQKSHFNYITGENLQNKCVDAQGKSKDRNLKTGVSTLNVQVEDCQSAQGISSASDCDSYGTPPDTLPSLESTAVGDQLHIKFSDLRLQMSRISLGSEGVSPEKQEDTEPVECLALKDDPDKTQLYVPATDSEEESLPVPNKTRRKMQACKKTVSSAEELETYPKAQSRVRQNGREPAVISDSEDEDDFEKFIKMVKKQPEQKKKAQFSSSSSKSSNKSMDDFIVPDSEVESSEGEDSVFYLKTDNGSKHREKTKYSESTSEEEEEEDAEKSDQDTDNNSDDINDNNNANDSDSDDNKSNNSDDDKDEVKDDEENEVYEATVIDISQSDSEAEKSEAKASDESSDDDFFSFKAKKPKSIAKHQLRDSDVSTKTPNFQILQHKLKKDNGIVTGADGALFKSPMFVPRKKQKGGLEHLPLLSPSSPVCKGKMQVVPNTVSTVRTQAMTEVHRVERERPRSAGSSESFLKSLSHSVPHHLQHRDALKYISNFKANREELTIKLFMLYNETVFDNKMPANMQVLWNNRLIKTAGMCRSKRDRTAPNGRVSKIELSTKVCDSAERVRDTLIHEMCHAAVWLNHGEHGGHGPLWKAYACRAVRVHRELPPISRCHAYDISYKYTYRCTKCGYQFGRHSKSLDTDRKVCGHCRGRFEVLVNCDTPAGTTSRTPRTPNKFALFVKDNFGRVKSQNQGAKHKDIMQILSQEFAKTSLT